MTSGRSLPGDTTDLRAGAPLADGLLALLPLVGQWSGVGSGVVPSDGRSFRYAQHVTFAHDGRPFLAYESRTWLLEQDGTVLRPGARETGFWRPGPQADDVEVVLALNTGLTLVLTGTAGDQRWELDAVNIDRTPSAVGVDGHRRLYAITGADLAYAHELAPAGRTMAAHLSGRLSRARVTERTAEPAD